MMLIVAIKFSNLDLTVDTIYKIICTPVLSFVRAKKCTHFNTIDFLMCYIPLIRSKNDADERLITIDIRVHEKLRISFANFLTK